MFAGSFQGITQTAPLAIFASFATDFPAALALSAVLVAVSGAPAADREAARAHAAARRGAGVMRAARRGRAELREFELDARARGRAGRVPGARRPVGRRQEHRPARDRRACTAPDRGRVALGDEVWLDRRAGVDLAPERRGCGYLFQEYALFPHLSAWRNVAFGLARRAPRRAPRPRGEALLAGFGRRGARRGAAARALRRRAPAGRARARARPRPAVLLLDEPLSALDSRTAASAARELAATLARSRVPTVLVTHDFAQAALLADEVAVIDRGRIVQRGTAGRAQRPAGAPRSSPTSPARRCCSAAPGAARRERRVVALDGGGEVASTDPAEGEVGVAVYPWEITLEPAGPARPRLGAQPARGARSTSVTEVGNRARIGLLASAAAGRRGHRASRSPGWGSPRASAWSPPGRRPRRGWSSAERAAAT